jgi:acetyl esterase/lipase
LMIFRSHALDILSAVDYLRKLPSIDPGNVVLVGTLSGSAACLYIASQAQPWLRGVINFYGGTDISDSIGPESLFPSMAKSFEILGTTSRIPMLWLFRGDEDSQSIGTIEALYSAFTKVGGRAVLRLFPVADEGEGHPSDGNAGGMWSTDLRAFVDELKLPLHDHRGFRQGYRTESNILNGSNLSH